MAAMSREAVSSNWKKLQEKIKSQDHTQKSQRGSDNAAIRKTTAGFKRKRISALKAERRSTTTDLPTSHVSNHSRDVKRRRTMGSMLSSVVTVPDKTAAAKRNSSLVRDHDIAPSDLAAAYGPTTAVSTSLIAQPDDAALTNTGLHATHKAGKYIALDCEMVGTGPPPSSDNLLARVSVVNYHGQLLYDSYVLPFPADTPVTDYRTAYSGIRPSHLVPGIARSFSEVQAAVSDLLKDKVLIGHALKNDMTVLMLSHPKRDLRDTARYPKYRIASKGKAPALRNLVREELNQRIQSGEHSSIEDARATMLLYRKEKAGFEAENRKTFGQPRSKTVGEGKAMIAKNILAGTSEGDDEDDAESSIFEDEEDEQLLEDEIADGDRGSGGSASKTLTTTGKSKRKIKKKKRTKRK